MAEEEPWLGLAEAAARTGLAREAIRSRARRGLVNSRKGNDGRLLVQILAGLAEADRADDRAMTDLLAEIAEVREALDRSMAERDAAVTVGEARVAAVRELADRLTAKLAEARKPWWRRLLSGLVICTLFLGSTVRAQVQDGKYACIVEKSYGIFDSNNEMTFGKLKLRNDKFIANVSRNESTTEYCDKLVDLDGLETTPGGRAFALLCSSSVVVDVSTDDWFKGMMVGDGINFYDNGSILDIFASEYIEGRFKFIKTVFFVTGDKTREQYTIIARCERF